MGEKGYLFFFPLSFAFSPSTLKIELTTLPNLGFQKVKSVFGIVVAVVVVVLKKLFYKKYF